MASRIDHGTVGPLWKPEKAPKKPRKYIKVKTDYRWIKTRELYLAGKANHQMYYSCEQCGRYVEGVEVHHKQTRGARKDLKYDQSNLIALCSQCHGAKHGQNRS